MVSQPGELIRLIYGEEPSAGDGAGNLDERLLRWADAFDAWLEERYTKFSRNVGPDSHRAWVEFLAFTRKEPWEVDVEEVEAFIEVLEERGLSAGTIQKRMTGLKSFYTFCQEKGIDRRCKAGSRSGSCGIKFNPAASARRPRVKQYAKANYLNLEEEEALLSVIKKDPSVIGKRDYALFLLLLRTGCPAGEARGLRWGTPEVSGQALRPKQTFGMQLRTSSSAQGRAGETGSRGAGGQGTLRLRSGQGRGAGEVWEAILVYLEASGRLESIKDTDYVFAPSKAALVKEAGNNAEDWAAERPLSMDQLHHLVKQYSGWAGLDESAITCHTLRHTAVVRRIEAGKAPLTPPVAPPVVHSRGRLSRGRLFTGQDRAGVQKGEGRQRSIKAEIFLKKVKHIPLRTRKISTKKFQPPSRGPGRFQLRNHMALKHGLRAKYLPEMEWLDAQGYEPGIFDRERFRLKTVWQRAMILVEEAETTKERMDLLEAAMMAVLKLGSLAMTRMDWLEAERRLADEGGEG
jgi:integrase